MIHASHIKKTYAMSIVRECVLIPFYLLGEIAEEPEDPGTPAANSHTVCVLSIKLRARTLSIQQKCCEVLPFFLLPYSPGVKICTLCWV
jgi:hypothetical protein